MPRTVETVVYELEELSGDGEGERSRLVSRDLPRTRVVRRRVRRLRDNLPDRRRDAQDQPRQAHGRRDAGKSPHLVFRGFASQGDGASFEGQYSHARGAARAIRAHAPKDEELHRIADELQAVQKRNFYQLNTAPSGRAATTATNTAWRSRSSATARPGSR